MDDGTSGCGVGADWVVSRECIHFKNTQGRAIVFYLFGIYAIGNCPSLRVTCASGEGGDTEAIVGDKKVTFVYLCCNLIEAFM